MGLSATEVMPIIRVINRLIFILSSSVAACMLAIARPRDFALLPKSCCAIPPSRRRIECAKRRLQSAIALSRNAAHAPLGSDGLFFFDGDFGRLDDRKDGVALFQIHSLH